MMKTRILARGCRKFVAAVLVAGLTAMPVLAAPSIDDLKKEKEAAESEVSSLQSELTTIIGKIDQLSADLVTKGEQIIEAEKDLKEAQEMEEQQYSDMKLRIKFMYEEGNSGVVETLVTSENFTDLVNKAEYVQNVHNYDREKLTEYVETKNKVKNLKATLESEQKEMEELQKEQEAQKASLDDLIASKQAEVANLDEEIKKAVEEAARAEAARKAAEEEAARRAAAAAAAASAPVNNPAPDGGGADYSQPTQSVLSGPAPGNTATAQAIVSAAYSQIGVPYVWGGTSPGVGLDCSGLTQYCHAVAGISIPRVDYAQRDAGTWVSDPQPGDIAWTPGHVGLYIGGGQMIEAQQPGTNIMISPVRASVYVRYW